MRRTEELEAIAKAVEILSSGDVSGNADKHLPGLVQIKKSVSFMQVQASSTSPVQARVAEFLRQKGSAINSRVLSALSVRVAEDPFVKVKKMIKVPASRPRFFCTPCSLFARLSWRFFGSFVLPPAAVLAVFRRTSSCA